LNNAELRFGPASSWGAARFAFGGAEVVRKTKLVLVKAKRPQLRKAARRDWSKTKARTFLSALAGWRFIAPIEGMTAYVRSSSVWAVYRTGAWELGILRGSNVTIGGQQVIGARSSAIAGPTGGSVVDTEVRSAVGQILNALRLHGLIET